MKYSTYTMVTVHKGLYFKVQNELCRIYLNQSTCDSEKIENWSKRLQNILFSDPWYGGVTKTGDQSKHIVVNSYT